MADDLTYPPVHYHPPCFVLPHYSDAAAHPRAVADCDGLLWHSLGDRLYLYELKAEGWDRFVKVRTRQLNLFRVLVKDRLTPADRFVYLHHADLGPAPWGIVNVTEDHVVEWRVWCGGDDITTDEPKRVGNSLTRLVSGLSLLGGQSV